MSSPRGLCDRDRCRAPLKRGKNDRSHFSPPPCTGPCRMRVVPVYASVCVRKRHGEKKKTERESMRHGHRKRRRRGRGSPSGFHKSGLRWAGDSWRSSPGKTGVRDTAGPRLPSDASVISHNTRTQRAQITQRQTPFPPLVAHHRVAPCRRWKEFAVDHAAHRGTKCGTCSGRVGNISKQCWKWKEMGFLVFFASSISLRNSVNGNCKYALKRRERELEFVHLMQLLCCVWARARASVTVYAH